MCQSTEPLGRSASVALRLFCCLALIAGFPDSAQATTFAELERGLLENNAQLRAAEQQLEAARRSAEAVESERWSPDVRLGASSALSRTDSGIDSSDTVAIERNEVNVGFTSSLNIFDSGAANIQTRLASNALDRERVQYTKTLISLYTELYIGYASLSVTADEIAENTALLKRQRNLESQTTAMLEAGTIDKSQLQSLQETLIDIEVTIVNLSRQREQDIERLWNLTQTSVSETTDAFDSIPDADLSELDAIERLFPDSLMASRLWIDNPDVVLAELSLAAEELRYNASEAAFGPSVSGNFQAGLSETLSPDSAFQSPESGSLSATLQLSIPIFDNGVRRSRRSAAAARQSASLDQVLQAKRNFVNDVNRGLFTLRAAQERRGLFSERLSLASEAVEDSEALVTSGRRTLFDFAQSLQREIDARSAFYQAKLDVFEARVNLLALLGIYR